MSLLMIVTLGIYAAVSFMVDAISYRQEVIENDWFIDPITNEFVEVERW